MEQTTLYFREGSSDKVYHAKLELKDGGYVAHFAFCRRGSMLQTSGDRTGSNLKCNAGAAAFDPEECNRMSSLFHAAVCVLSCLLLAGCLESQPDYTPFGNGMKAIGICLVVYAVVNGLFSLVQNEKGAKPTAPR